MKFWNGYWHGLEETELTVTMVTGYFLKGFHGLAIWGILHFYCFPVLFVYAGRQGEIFVQDAQNTELTPATN